MMLHPGPMSSEHTVLMVGSMAFDDLELPSGKFDNVIGGAATYSALAATLFAPARMVAVVGEDFPTATLQTLEHRGADTQGVQRAAGKTFRWKGRYAADLSSRETLDTQLNVFADFSPQLPPEYRSSPFVLLGNIHPQLQLEVLSQVQRPRLVAADTMNFWIEGERATLHKMLSHIDTLIINDEELRLLAEDHNIRRSAQRVLTLGPKRLIVKRGDAGALLFEGPDAFFAPAMPLHEELDPTGAGDTFAGALMGYLASQGAVDHQTLRQAMLVGAAVASICVEGVGNSKLLEANETTVQARLDEIKQMLAF